MAGCLVWCEAEGVFGSFARSHLNGICFGHSLLVEVERSRVAEGRYVCCFRVQCLYGSRVGAVHLTAAGQVRLVYEEAIGLLQSYVLGITAGGKVVLFLVRCISFQGVTDAVGLGVLQNVERVSALCVGGCGVSHVAGCCCYVDISQGIALAVAHLTAEHSGMLVVGKVYNRQIAGREAGVPRIVRACYDGSLCVCGLPTAAGIVVTVVLHHDAQ